MSILYPVFALVGLTFFVLFRMAFLRLSAARSGEVDASFYRAYQGAEPEKLRIVSRHFNNLLEMPPLFYLACIIAFLTQQQGTLVLTLAWSFVAARLIHSVIHLGSNVVIWRFRTFLVSILLLIALWLTLLVGLLGR